MDKLSIKTAFLRHILSNMATKKIRKVSGYHIDGIIIEDLDASMDDRQAVIRISGEIRLPPSEVNKIITNLGW